jgi:hypothetical protein
LSPRTLQMTFEFNKIFFFLRRKLLKLLFLRIYARTDLVLISCPYA